MRTAAIHFYTGTGNSRHAAEVAARELGAAGYAVTTTHIMRDTVPPQGPFDLHLFIYPVYGLTYPEGIRRYVARLPEGKGTRAAVIANHGMLNLKGGINTGYEGAGLDDLARKIAAKGYAAVYTDKVGYPENITLVAHALADETVAAIVAAGDEKMRTIARDIAAGKELRQTYSLSIRFMSAAFGFLYNYLGRWSIGKFFAAGRRCTGCGHCAEICPAQNIAMRGGTPDWGWRCHGCLACFNRCPHDAVQATALRLLFLGIGPVVPLVLFVVYFAEITALFGPSCGPAAPVAASVAAVAFTAAATYLADRWLYLFERIPGLGRLTTLSHTAFLRRYRGPKC